MRPVGTTFQTPMTRRAFIAGTAATTAALAFGCDTNGSSAPSLTPGVNTPGITPVKPPVTALKDYTLGKSIVPFGSVSIGAQQYFAGLANQGNWLVATTASFGDTSAHQLMTGLMRDDGANLTATTFVNARLGAPVINPNNHAQVAATYHNVETNEWGWNLFDVNTGELTMSTRIPGTYANGLTFSASGELAVGSSNFQGGNTFAASAIHFYDLARYLDSKGREGKQSVQIPERNLNGMAYVNVDGANLLFAVTTGAITSSGLSKENGALLCIPRDAYDFAAVRLTVPGGLNIGQKLALSIQPKSIAAALPSATNDGKVLVSELLELHRRAGFEETLLHDLQVPIIPGHKNLVTAPVFSPDGKYLFVANQDLGRGFVYNMQNGKLLNEDGYLLDPLTGASEQEIVDAHWTERGLLVAMGQKLLLIPHEDNQGV